ncbi:MAG: hypothetical protein K2I21_05295 [Acetatifactor sp.]|nr:hypothetical protein [Acetatifactor sp.]
MRVTVVGKENVNYVKNGQPVQGIKLYVTYPFAPNKKDVEGVACDAPYFGSRFEAYHQAALINVGDEVDLFYNQYGRIDTLQVVSPSSAPVAPPDKK